MAPIMNLHHGYGAPTASPYSFTIHIFVVDPNRSEEQGEKERCDIMLSEARLVRNQKILSIV